MSKLTKSQIKSLIEILDTYIVPFITEEDAKEYLPKFVKQVDKEHFNAIKNQIETQIIRGCEEQIPEYIISGGFLWLQSNEGADYWDNFYHQIAQQVKHGSFSNTSR